VHKNLIKTAAAIALAVPILIMGPTAATIAPAPSSSLPDVSPANATGGFKGFPVGVQIQVKGKGLHVDKIFVTESWAAKFNGGRYGHTEVFNRVGKKNVTIGKNSNHTVSSALPGGRYQVNKPSKNYANGSKICARWWNLINGKYSNNGSSCVTIHR